MPKDQLTQLWAKPLPTPLVQRCKARNAAGSPRNKMSYTRLADEGQRPRREVICRCDSRIDKDELGLLGVRIGIGWSELQFLRADTGSFVPV